MTKFKIDPNKEPQDQPYWNLLKPEVKLEHIKSWKVTESEVDKLIATGEVVIDPNIPKRNIIVTIPDDQLTKEKGIKGQNMQNKKNFSHTDDYEVGNMKNEEIDEKYCIEEINEIAYE